MPPESHVATRTPNQGTVQDAALNRRRRIKDRITRYLVAIGGIAVILAVLLIIVNLGWVVVPLLKAASIEPVASTSMARADAPRALGLDEQGQLALGITADARIRFFDPRTGTVRQQGSLRAESPPASRVSASRHDSMGRGLLTIGFGDGRVQVLKQDYHARYGPEGQRTIEPGVAFPYGESPQVLDPQGRVLLDVDLTDGDDSAVLGAITEDARIVVRYVEKHENFLSGETTLSTETFELHPHTAAPTHLIVAGNQRLLFVTNADSSISLYSLQQRAVPSLLESRQATLGGARITVLTSVLGGVSVLIGDDHGNLTQWFAVRKADNRIRLERAREFKPMSSAITTIVAEPRRKGFAAFTALGNMGLYYTTANRQVGRFHVSEAPVTTAILAPRSNAMLFLADDSLHFFSISNPYPEVSLGSLWRKVWYENYPDPAYIWQSSAASTDFEPKFSFTPLVFGTLKAAFYSMLFAVPLALMAAIFTAYFMAAPLRRRVKPAIEIMAALPTVILGFLGGLWLAPYLENHLVGIFSVLLVVPPGIVLFAAAWPRLSSAFRIGPLEGWQPAVLLPVLVALIWLGLALGQPLEQAWFAGDFRHWLQQTTGLGFDQRNALVVGIVMGFAVIPSIFSIAEDAVFSVPVTLSNGSLALGATPWQTLLRVVLPTASPGMFSGLMMGLGRAVGETMIVLMATGNTPIMDANIFEGMRTLAANIAVEMPEAALNSTHYRVLFLSALVLFAFTFLVNTGAEVIRQRLREKYGNL